MNPKYISRLERIDYLIRKKATGTPEELAQRLGIHVSKVYETISYLKSLGAPISYSIDRQSYYYQSPGGFSFRFNSHLP